MTFHNPYHFVPAKGEDRPDDMPMSAWQEGQVGHVTHDRFLTRTEQGVAVYSGRIICRLTTEDPMVIGAERSDDSRRVQPFTLDNKPAIPASTLRGLISSLAEAASDAALRILDNRILSHRVDMQHSLSALGMIVETVGEDGALTFRLRPLALPTMTGPSGGAIPLEERYRAMFPIDRPPLLKVYVGDARQIRSDTFPFQTFSRECPQWYYAKLHPQQWNPDHTLPLATGQNRKPGGAQDYLVSQIPIDTITATPPQDVDERQHYVRGIMRVLGTQGREDIPNTKKHELFLPYPEDIETTPTFPILPEAIEQFYLLADERTAARKEEPPLPYEPRGTVRNKAPEDENDQRFRLKDGDLVFFKPNPSGDAVDEIALSAIWRRAVGTTHTYFHGLSPELLPLHRGRQRLGLAEQLFGFVEYRPEAHQTTETAWALASRVRFAFGRLHPDPGPPYYDIDEEDGVMLKILDTPKPPMPAFYFKLRNGRGSYIAKNALHPDHHVPQGRKVYLHKQARAIKPWRTNERTENLTQKSWVKPIKAGCSFYFHIDFANLSEPELGMLCYALRPTAEFRHKIGMGKPVGLGKVRLDPVGIWYIDRLKRYQETSLFEATRYHSAWVQADEQPGHWPDLYTRERQEYAQGLAPGPDFAALHAQFAATMDRDIRHAIELLGNPDMVRHEVHTPQVEEARTPQEREQKTYEWFVANDKASDRQRQYLAPLTYETRELPTLERWPRPN